MLRSCYSTNMNITGVGDVPIRWYWCADDAPDLAHPTVYNSRNWDLQRERPQTGPGEVVGAGRPYDKGTFPDDQCTTPKGSAAAWLGEVSPLIQCHPMPLARGGIVLGGHAIVMVSDPVMGGGGIVWGGSGGFPYHWSAGGGIVWGGDGGFNLIPPAHGGIVWGGSGTFGVGDSDMPYTGEIRMFGNTSPPDAFWFPCDGAAVSRATYAGLFAIIGTSFGVGDGSTTFNVPDMRSRSPIGEGTGVGLATRAMGAIGGEEAHVQTLSELAAHTHPQATTTLLSTAGSQHQTPTGTNNRARGGTTSVSGSSDPMNVMHPFQAVAFFIHQ